MQLKGERRVLAEGRWVRLVAQDHWEWAERTNVPGAVVIAAVTEDQELVLVEQYRIPLAARVIEMPAGLVGDTAHDEAWIEAARRELLEETGYQAKRLKCLAGGPASAGMTNETYSLYLATGMRRVADGGGEEGEDIVVHVVPLAKIERWLASRRKQGVLVDPRVYAGLYFVLRGQGAKLE